MHAHRELATSRGTPQQPDSRQISHVHAAPLPAPRLEGALRAAAARRLARLERTGGPPAVHSTAGGRGVAELARTPRWAVPPTAADPHII